MTTLQNVARTFFAPIALMLGTLLALWAFSSLSLEPSMAGAQAVTVTASVAQTTTCTASASSTSFGTLTTSAVDTASPNTDITVSCNAAGGCTLSVGDVGDGTNPGLYNASGTALIASANATLVAGTEGYGIQGAITANGGSSPAVDATYLVSGNQVGGLTTSASTLAVANAPVSGAVVQVKHLAAISASTVAGSYTDTITYSCTAN